MPNSILFDQGGHQNILLEDFASGSFAVQANQHLIIRNGEGIILDPGGHKVYSKVLAETTSLLGRSKLKYIFLSHQDPDIVAAANGWLMTTDATAYTPSVWTRFIPHFGLDRLVADRLKPIPDAGMTLELGGIHLMVIPAHFLHSCGNFHLYDPVSKILYSGDLGASLGAGTIFVENFDNHIQYIEGFHKRYMASNAALRLWLKAVRQLDIETIAPQHGAIFKGKEVSLRLLDWLENLSCGVDLMEDLYHLPETPHP